MPENNLKNDAPIVELKDVEYFYSEGTQAEVHALKKVSLEIKRGEYVAFFGPSGCGKSTLLYLIAGIERPTSGEVLVDGKNMNDLSEMDLEIFRQSGVGIIFQNFNLIPSISVLENVAMPLAFLGVSSNERNEKAGKILERLGISNLAGRYPFELSGGQQQRVGIARALANDPPLILADEPLGNLDSKNANAVLDYLEEFHEGDGRTIIMVTHEEWSLHGAGKIFHMKDGEVTKVETKEPKKDRSERPEQKVGPGKMEVQSPQNLAKAYSNYLLHGYPKEEVERLEQLVFSWFNGEIDGEKFKNMLDTPFKKGGVGIRTERADKITKSVGDFIIQSKNLGAMYQKILKEATADVYNETVSMRHWLLEDSKSHFEDAQIDILDRTIGDRIRRFIPDKQFVHTLNLSKNYGGVGMRIDVALKIGEKLETLLGEKLTTVNLKSEENDQSENNLS